MLGPTLDISEFNLPVLACLKFVTDDPEKIIFLIFLLVCFVLKEFEDKEMDLLRMADL